MIEVMAILQQGDVHKKKKLLQIESEEPQVINVYITHLRSI